MKLEFTRLALEDIEGCLLWSAESFGATAARRYDALLFVSLEGIREDPMLPGSGHREGLSQDIRFFHLRHLRKKAAVNGLIVKTPRHFVVYRQIDTAVIQILRVLHDRMDVQDQLRN